MSAKMMGHTNTPTKPVTSREIKEQLRRRHAVGRDLTCTQSAAEAERKTRVSSSNITQLLSWEEKIGGKPLLAFHQRR